MAYCSLNEAFSNPFGDAETINETSANPDWLIPRPKNISEEPSPLYVGEQDYEQFPYENMEYAYYKYLEQKYGQKEKEGIEQFSANFNGLKELLLLLFCGILTLVLFDFVIKLLHRR